MEFFINEIIADEEIKEILRMDPEGLKPKARALADDMIATGTCENPGDGMLPLFVLGYLADWTLNEVHAKRNIPREITVATLRDVNLWIENYRIRHNAPGTLEFNWLKLQNKGELYRLGRLQFRPVKTDRAPSGEWVLETHIPQGEPLAEEECLKSFAMAKDFFPVHFPEVSADYFDCSSWLLNPNFAYVMGENSNVVKFMRMWELKTISLKDNSGATISRVFGLGTKRDKLPVVPEKTTMQKKVKAFLMAGGDLSSTYGVRKING